MKVVIIGTGNVATVLGRKIVEAGHEIVQVIGRNQDNLTLIASLLNAAATSNIYGINLLADLYIITVSDSAIQAVVKELKLNDHLVVHTAGAVSKEMLATCSVNYGVLYPLQSLKKEMEIIPEIPFLIDGSNVETLDALQKFALQLSHKVLNANDEQRLKLHIAAVFANNFTNHILAAAYDYCIQEKLEFNILYSLIKETIVRIEKVPPSQAQTGPAVRNDNISIEKHQQILQAHPFILNLYNTLTDSIKAYYANNKSRK